MLINNLSILMSNTNTVSNEINFTSEHSIKLYTQELINSYKLHKLKDLNINKIQNQNNYNHYYIFISCIFNYLESNESKNNIIKNYKLSFYEDLICFIIDNLCKYKHVKQVFDIINNGFNLMYFVLTCTIHGHIHLNKIKKYIPNIIIENTQNFLVTKDILNKNLSKFYKNNKYNHQNFYKWQRNRLNILIEKDGKIF